jgi:hypothetical protein
MSSELNKVCIVDDGEIKNYEMWGGVRIPLFILDSPTETIKVKKLDDMRTGYCMGCCAATSTLAHEVRVDDTVEGYLCSLCVDEINNPTREKAWIPPEHPFFRDGKPRSFFQNMGGKSAQAKKGGEGQ